MAAEKFEGNHWRLERLGNGRVRLALRTSGSTNYTDTVMIFASSEGGGEALIDGVREGAMMTAAGDARPTTEGK